MNRQTILTFGKGAGFKNGYLTHQPGVVFKTHGVAGIIQPYQMYVPDNCKSNHGPFMHKSVLTSAAPDSTSVPKKLVSTHYMEGHGKTDKADKDSRNKSRTSESSEPSTSEDSSMKSVEEKTKEKRDNQTEKSDTLTGLEAIEKASTQPVKISEQQFKRKLQALEGEDGGKTNKKKHKFNLI